ncbi:TonB-dependent receptor plug domain-containing protein [Pareuzebyella sediminis]|uniref:TonB-dependent receptor plug domain-containing protein n=1 Tax=Pareuzebyella sediminis TaxID=2607998 RepID=UPI0011EFB4F5|nr:TonB-dependent receptor plug domain-containing protein [Pareuzebyella sediminis]
MIPVQLTHKSLFLISSIILVFIHQFSEAQEANPLENIIGGLVTYADINTPEKVYLQTDKDFYINGETIWFKTYVLNGITHSPRSKSQVVYVELVDSKDTIVARRKLYTASLGASADITLSEDTQEGIYTLRAYTKYMLNAKEPIFFKKQIIIGAQRKNPNEITETIFENEKTDTLEKKAVSLGPDKPIVQFFPEGGDLVTGIESILGIKITDKEGNGLALKGKIFDQNGNLESVFESYEFGLGQAQLAVAPDTNYYLRIQIEDKTFDYPVPAPLLNGYTLRVMNMGSYLKISAATNIANGLRGALLVGHLRGGLIYKEILKKNVENRYTLKLLTSKLQDGIAHFTLFTPNGEPVCERLTFIENANNAVKLSIKTDKTDYGLRNMVNVDMALVEDDGKPLDGDFSVSVVTQKGLRKNPETMKSWLLLNSDLGGVIPNPNFFFQEDLKGREFLLDLLMLTHGWRRFEWTSFLKGGVRKALDFPPEKGIMINGITTAFDNRHQPKRALTTLNVFTEKISQEVKQTNAQGNFSFGPFFFQDSITAVINAKSLPENKNSHNQVSIYLDPPFPKIKVNAQKEQFAKSTTKVYARPYFIEAQRQKITDYKHGPKITRLKEVVVKSKRKTEQERIIEELNSRTLYGEARNRIFPDSVPWMQNALSIFDILRTVPGVQVFGSFPNQSVQIAGLISFRPVPPLFLINGMRVDESFIRTMPIFDVRFVDVLKGADAAIYGMRSAGGVIAVYTKTGSDMPVTQKRFPGVANATIPGFYKTRQFYAPNYALTIPDHNKPDYRTTLYWNPDVAIKGETSSSLNFYTGDSAGTYIIRVEGITSDGRPVNKLFDFQVLESFP